MVLKGWLVGKAGLFNHEEQSLNASTPFTTTHNYSFKKSNTLFWPLWAPSLGCAYTHRHKQNKNKSLKIIIINVGLNLFSTKEI